MKKLVLFLLFCWCVSGYAASDPATFSLSHIKVADAVELMYTQVLKTPFVIQSDVLADERMVTFRFNTGTNARQEIGRFLTTMGLAVHMENGVDVIGTQKEAKIDKSVFVYRPKYRDVSYLVELVRGLFADGEFTTTRAIHGAPQAVTSDTTAGQPAKQPAVTNTAAALVDTTADAMVFNGTPADIKRLTALLEQLDIKQGEVMVRGQVFEVSTDAQEGSAFSLALSVLGGKFSAGLSTLSTLDGFVRLKTSSIDAVFAALSNDSRFKTISAPSLRVRSGATGRFSVGQDVPVLAAVTYPGTSSAPVQSV